MTKKQAKHLFESIRDYVKASNEHYRFSTHATLVDMAAKEDKLNRTIRDMVDEQ